MKKHFADFKADKEKAKKKKAEVDRRAAEPSLYHSRESEEASIDEDEDEEAQMEAAIQASLYEQREQEEVARHRQRF